MGIKVKIKNSTVILHQGALLEEIESFDLSKATPVDCLVFIRQLKERYGRR